MSRMLRLGIACVMLFGLFVVLPAHAQDVVGFTSDVLNVRATPAASGTLIATLEKKTDVVVEARNDASTWLLIRTIDGSVHGWVSAGFIVLPAGYTIGSFPVSGASGNVAAPPPDAPPVDSGQPIEATPTPGDLSSQVSPQDATSELLFQGAPIYPIPEIATADLGTITAKLDATPILYNFTNPSIHEIYEKGKELQNRPRVFTRVGDSITAEQPFLIGFGQPGQYNLGGYGNLQGVIDYFNEPPREGFPNSFTYTSLTALSGFNAGAPLDTLWSDSALCAADEAPILCEFRLVKPAIAIVMLGSVDIQVHSLQHYVNFMNRNIEIMIDYGVIPVLTTFTVSRDYIYYEQSLRFNAVILEIAERHGLPVINLWKAQRALPDDGVGPDRYHLSQGPTYYSFTGEETQYGVTLRNLLTLQALEELRKDVPLP